MRTDGSDFPPKFLQIKKDDTFFSRLMAKEESGKAIGDSSFRVMYYGGGAGSIPFTWESWPGTPKHTFSHAFIPPLTPPPSYQSSHKANSTQIFSPKSKILYSLFEKIGFTQNYSKFKLFHSGFPKIGSKKMNVSPSYSSTSVSSLSSTSSYSLPSTPMNFPLTSRRKFVPRSRSAVDIRVDDDDNPTSSFGSRNGNRRMSRAWYKVKSMRRAFLSIAGYGTA